MVQKKVARTLSMKFELGWCMSKMLSSRVSEFWEFTMVSFVISFSLAFSEICSSSLSFLISILLISVSMSFKVLYLVKMLS